jgi:sugar phosphate isomerase/epimerase
MMMKAFKIGISGESLRPLSLSPFETLDWAIMNEADGVQFGGPDPGPAGEFDHSFLKELAEYADENHLYLEWGGGLHFPRDPSSGASLDLLAVNRKAAETARVLGLDTVLSRSDGPARWTAGALPPGDLARLTAENLKGLRPMLEDLGIVLAVEPSCDLSTFDLLRIFEMTETAPGRCFGVCFDPLVSLAGLEDPVAAARRILPWIMATRIRDGGTLLTGEGFTTFAAEAGTGVIDFPEIFAGLSSIDRRINLSLADHGGDILVPVFDPSIVSKFPDLGAAELMAILRLSLRSQELLDEGHLALREPGRPEDQGERRIKRGLRALRRIVEEGGR